jgi:hypothetical protein
MRSAASAAKESVCRRTCLKSWLKYELMVDLVSLSNGAPPPLRDNIRLASRDSPAPGLSCLSLLIMLSDLRITVSIFLASSSSLCRLEQPHPLQQPDAFS